MLVALHSDLFHKTQKERKIARERLASNFFMAKALLFQGNYG
jgi:hypothetical protein